jgi:uncharacterized protein (TIGR02246 family)
MMSCILIGGFLFWSEPQPASSLSAAERAVVEKSILETSAQMTEAAEDRDIDRLFGFMLDTDRGSVIQNGRVLLTRTEALEQTKKNMSGISSIQYRWKQQHVTVVSPTVALLIAEGESSATTEQGQSFTAPFAQTVVFVLNDGRWRALHAHQSSPRR